jgi:hypothetical protein
MKLAVIAAAILSSISRAGCFETTSQASAGRARDSLIPKRSRLKARIAHGCRFRSAAAARERSRGHYHPAGVSGAGDRQSRLRPRSLSGLKDLIADADALSGGKNCG